MDSSLLSLSAHVISAINIAIIFTFHPFLECGCTDKEINSKDVFHIYFGTQTHHNKCICWMFPLTATVSCFRMMESVKVHFLACVQLTITAYIGCLTEGYKSKLSEGSRNPCARSQMCTLHLA